MNWLYLSLAILSEVIGTSALKSSNGFSKLIPTLLMLVSYSFSFYFLSLTLRTIPVGLAYAIWSGAGIILISLIGYIFYKQNLDIPAILGIFLIGAGVIIINLFSKSIG